MQTKGAIVIGGYVNGLGLVRALASRGVPAAVLTTQPFDVAQRSRWCVAHRSTADLDRRPEALVEALAPWAQRFAGWALLPTNDEALAALALQRDALERSFRPVAPSWEIAQRTIDKRAQTAAAVALGIDVPRSHGVADEAILARADVPFPVVVKPTIGHRFHARYGQKLFVARDARALRRQVAQLRDAGLDADVMDLVPGGDDHIYVHCTYVDDHGVAQPGVTVRKLRQSPPSFGVARVAEVVDEIPVLRAATEALLRRLDFRGIAAAEFKVDPRDGRFRFIEVNGRAVLYNALLHAAGLDVAGLAWSEHVARRPERQRASSWRGVWVNLHADLLYSALRNDEGLRFREFSAPYRRPLVEAVWSARDPRPFLAQWGRSARLGAGALLRPERLRALLATSALAPRA